MSGAEIWWRQIGTQIRLLSDICARLDEEQSFLFCLEHPLPWRDEFFRAVNSGRSRYSQDRRLRRLPWVEGKQPGALVLEQLCPASVQVGYYPGMTYAEYLGSQGDLILCDYFVWVTDIHRRSDLNAWFSFVQDYRTAAEKLERQAVFILEYDGPSIKDNSSIRKLTFCIERSDCMIFSLQTAAELHNSLFPDYQAELALRLSNNDPEFAAALLETGEQMLAAPVETAEQIIATGRNSGGRPFPVQRKQKLNSACWWAAIIQLFPTLERFRSDFIQKYHDALQNCLPVSNTNGDIISDASDLELGVLYSLVSKGKLKQRVRQEDEAKLYLCRKVRNLLAHNRPVSYEDVKQVLRKR